MLHRQMLVKQKYKTWRNTHLDEKLNKEFVDFVFNVLQHSYST